MKKITCIICAYNEAARIAGVLKIVQKHPLIAEVLVVDDGSTDDTARQVEAFKGITLLRMKKNGGKTKALLTGIKKSKNNTLLLLDADLSQLTSKNITDLIEPISEGRADMSISLRKNSFRIHKILGLDFSSGERVFEKKLLSGHEQALSKLPHFGFEVFLNRLFLQKKAKLAVVWWPNVTHARKSEKRGWLGGTYADFKMAFDMIKTVGIRELIRQNVGLWKAARAYRQKS